MSQLLYEWSNLTKASSHLGEGMEECARWGPVDGVVESHVSLVRLQLAQGNTGSALDTLKQAEQRAQGQSLDPWISTWLDDCRVRLWLATGRLDAAIQWSASDGPRFDGPLSYHRDLDHVNLARVLCAQGAQDPSGPYLTQALDLLDDTADWPEISRPKWTCEVTEPVVWWLVQASEGNIGRFERNLKKGRLAISSLSYNGTPPL